MVKIIKYSFLKIVIYSGVQIFNFASSLQFQKSWPRYILTLEYYVRRIQYNKEISVYTYYDDNILVTAGIIVNTVHHDKDKKYSVMLQKLV